MKPLGAGGLLCLGACVCMLVLLVQAAWEGIKADYAHQRYFEMRVYDRIAGAAPEALFPPRSRRGVDVDSWALQQARLCQRRGGERSACIRHANHAVACYVRVIHTGKKSWSTCQSETRSRIANEIRAMRLLQS